MASAQLETASGLVHTAISLERTKQTRLAAAKYMDAVSVYIKGLQDDKLNQAERAFIITNVAAYSTRARDLLDTVSDDLQSTHINHVNIVEDRPVIDASERVRQQDKAGDEELSDRLNSAVVVSKPHVSWDDVIGLEDAKEPMQETVLIPILFPGSPQAAFAHKGLLLFGPGGVGKTQLCKALATEADNATFITVRPDMLLSKWMGESEKLVRGLFELARKRKPSIIFIDEVDSFCGSRSEEGDSSRRFKNSLLCEMDGMDDMTGVFVVGATNQPFSIDASFMRRFPRRVYVPLPNTLDRGNIIKSKLAPYTAVMTDADIKYVAKKTEGYSGADLQTVVTEAGLQPYRDFMAKRKARSASEKDIGVLRPIILGDFKQALTKCGPANPPALIRKLEDWNAEYGDARTLVDLSSPKAPGPFQIFFDVFGFPF